MCHTDEQAFLTGKALKTQGENTNISNEHAKGFGAVR